MVISIHQNSYVTPKAEGAQVFYYTTIQSISHLNPFHIIIFTAIQAVYQITVFPTTESAAYFAESVLIQLRIQAVDFYLKADTAFFRIIFMPHRPFDRLDTCSRRTQYYRILSFRLRIEQITINTLVLLIQLKSDQVTVYFVRRIFLYVLFGYQGNCKTEEWKSGYFYGDNERARFS